MPADLFKIVDQHRSGILPKQLSLDVLDLAACFRRGTWLGATLSLSFTDLKIAPLLLFANIT